MARMFDRAGAKAAGYTDQEIDQYLAQIPKGGQAVANPYAYLNQRNQSGVMPDTINAPATGGSSGFFDENILPGGATSGFNLGATDQSGIPSVAANPQNPFSNLGSQSATGGIDWSKINLNPSGSGFSLNTQGNGGLKLGGY